MQTFPPRHFDSKSTTHPTDSLIQAFIQFGTNFLSYHGQTSINKDMENVKFPGKPVLPVLESFQYRKPVLNKPKFGPQAGAKLGFSSLGRYVALH